MWCQEVWQVMPAAEPPPLEEPQFSIPNLGSLVVISQSIALFQIQPNLKLVVRDSTFSRTTGCQMRLKFQNV